MRMNGRGNEKDENWSARVEFIFGHWGCCFGYAGGGAEVASLSGHLRLP